MSFPENLKTLRGTHSRKDFAAQLGIQPNTLRNYEEGHSLPNFELGMFISRKFNVSPEWLLSGEGPMYREQHAQPAQLPSPDTDAGPCPRCAKLEKELEDLRQEQRKERSKNDDLIQALLKERDRNEEVNATVLRLTQENAELRIQLARAAPDSAEATRRSA